MTREFRFPMASLSAFLLLGALGPVQAGWVANGNAVCTATGDQGGPCAISDGRGGAIIVWTDYRNGNSDIYAQRIDGYGDTRWGADDVAICAEPTDQGGFAVVSDGAGGAILAWTDFRNDSQGDIYAQRVDKDGNVQWAVDGIAICTGPTHQRYPTVFSDGSHGAIISWFTYQEGTGYSEFSYYAQRIDGSGILKWQPEGEFVYCVDYPYRLQPLATSDGSGGVFFAWAQWAYPFAYNHDIWGQHLDSCGTRLWNPDGKEMISYFEDQFYPDMVSDGARGVIIAYQDILYATEGLDVVAQRFDASGNKLWDGMGVRVGSTYGLGDCAIVSDGAGGAVVTWHQSFTSFHNAQRVDPNGQILWAPQGIDIGDRPAQTMRADGSGGMFMVWGDITTTAARLLPSGDCAWEHVVCNASGSRSGYQIVSDGEGGALIAWQDNRSGAYDIYATRITREGEIPVATLLQSWHLGMENSLITITWTLSEVHEEARFFVLRSRDGGTYEELDAVRIHRQGPSFTCVDETCRPGVRYMYRVDVSDGRGRRVLFESNPISLPPLKLALFQNCPNPFNPSTTIRYSIPERALVTLEIYDIAGRMVARLVHEQQQSGLHAAQWNGNDTRGNPASSGIYVYRLMAGKRTITRKAILLR